MREGKRQAQENQHGGRNNLSMAHDSKPPQSAIGRRIIQIYYNNFDSINALLERSVLMLGIVPQGNS
jgi:hypothetical protein